MNKQDFQLYVRRGPEPGKVYSLTSVSVAIGRDPMSDITINDPEVSRRHAQLVSSPNGYTIQDLGSTNGTMIDGQRLSGEAIELKPGQVITMGTGVSLVFEVVSLEEDDEEPMTVINGSKTVIVNSAPFADEEPQSPASMEYETESDKNGIASAATIVEPELPGDSWGDSEADSPLIIAESPQDEFQDFFEQPAAPVSDQAQEPIIPPAAVVIPQGPQEIKGADDEKGGRPTMSIVIAIILILCCCCSSLAIFMYFYGGDWLLRQLGIMP